ncbi:AAA family ATPase [Candidatus Ponderosibacter sp. Uisw_141_02]|uniref:AAA family ATPase n=1 Tax=Candidatus Ponderosibacter sp. Uisw_141_02 TaxID=3231000 RepID=UPI003D43DCC2
MIFRSLKMAGFKSFAESAEVEIDSGLTGIVGPNGCGKSNIVEGLRWVMGESSARQMRGGEMDDVIFGGTEQRPARNLAEITLQLDNRHRQAPAEFNDVDELEITRKIERGKGSSYYVNAKPARARDVQLLFADTATGARSSGIVSQGRIGAIVGAKPVDRRTLIEEAANIRGLHARRHEAELRLRAAETNLERLDDVIAGLIEQRDSLRKQARQAARYRSVADRIRKAEAQFLLARWMAAEQDRDAATAALGAAKLDVGARAKIAARCATARSEIAASLPPLRASEAEKAAEYQRLALGREELDREEARVTDALTQLANRQNQLTQDIARETSLLDDAKSAVARLADEAESLAVQIAEASPQQAAAKDVLEAARLTASQNEANLAEASAALRAAATTRHSLASRKQDIENRIQSANAALAQLSLETLLAEATQSDQAKQETEADFMAAKSALETAEQTLTDANAAAESALNAKRDSESHMTRLQAEIDALQYLLADLGDHDAAPIADQLSVSDGMETALAGYLADELAAPVGSGNQGFWREGSKASLSPPDGTMPLADFVTGAPALAASLAGVGVVDDASTAEALQFSLLPGQAIATKSGSLWRWDGFVRHANQSDKSAERIRQRRRLDALQDDAAKAGQKLDQSGAIASSSETTLIAAREHLQSCRSASMQAEQAFGDSRRHAESDALKLAAGRDRAAELNTSLDELATSLANCEVEIAGLADDAALAAGEVAARNAAETSRTALTEAMQAESRLADLVGTATRRQSSCNQEASAWQQRLDGASGRIAELEKRLIDDNQEQHRLETLPETIAKQRLEIGDRLEIAEQNRQDAADALRLAETSLAEAESLQRDSDNALATARETQIRAEAGEERCNASLAELKDRIADKLNCAPKDVAEIAGIEDGEALASLDVLEERVHRLIRERDNIGPVNLRAEAEMEDVATRITSMETERDDLIAAIGKLRAAISQLNREGRERLLKSFGDVNEHFKRLFKKLFGGGTAELQLTNADDPLEAGLEILASPPGKRLQSLSLLSGGEQALTALAIIFAVFLTNPAPICVLDEVDAPLDDSNVVRFCDLLRDICDQTDTRFLVITHHRMTMARMDRLFGITMEQRGISKLVSVDLQTAERIRDNAVA